MDNRIMDRKIMDNRTTDHGKMERRTMGLGTMDRRKTDSQPWIIALAISLLMGH